MGQRRSAIAIVVFVWFCLQVCIPLSYYLHRIQVDKFDEAYAWRMFSDIAMVRTSVSWYAWPRNASARLAPEDAHKISAVHLFHDIGGVWSRRFILSSPLWLHDSVASWICHNYRRDVFAQARMRAAGYVRVTVPWDSTKEERVSKIVLC